MLKLALIYLRYTIGRIECKIYGHQGALLTLKNPGSWADSKPKEWVIRCPNCGTEREKITLPNPERKFKRG